MRARLVAISEDEAEQLARALARRALAFGAPSAEQYEVVALILDRYVKADKTEHEMEQP